MSAKRGKWCRRVSDTPMRLTLLLTTMCASASANTATTIQPSKECVEPRLPPVKREVKLAVIAPADPRHEQGLPRVLPAVFLAVRAISSSRGPLPGWKIKVDHRDSRCSSTYGPLAAFDFYINRTAGHHSFFHRRDAGDSDVGDREYRGIACFMFGGDNYSVLSMAL